MDNNKTVQNNSSLKCSPVKSANSKKTKFDDTLKKALIYNPRSKK